MIESWDDFVSRHGPLVEGSPGRYTPYRELSVLLTLAARRQPSRILEMFTAYGHTACALAKACPQSTVHAFDVSREAGGYDHTSPFVGEVMSVKDVGSQILQASESLRSRILLTVAEASLLSSEIRKSAPYEFIFVDGDHSWRGVRDDTLVALEVAKDDATIVWDDYWKPCPDVVRFVDALNARVTPGITIVHDTHVCYATLTPGMRRQLIDAIPALQQLQDTPEVRKEDHP